MDISTKVPGALNETRKPPCLTGALATVTHFPAESRCTSTWQPRGARLACPVTFTILPLAATVGTTTESAGPRSEDLDPGTDAPAATVGDRQATAVSVASSSTERRHGVATAGRSVVIPCGNTIPNLTLHHWRAKSHGG